MSILNWLFNPIPRLDFQRWILDSIYRVDAGLFEIEEDYRKKKIVKKIISDAKYNQLEGKFTMLAVMLQDFHITFGVSTFGDRIIKRIKKRGRITIYEKARQPKRIK